jgi:predicted CXXCH cytochrome family protein
MRLKHWVIGIGIGMTLSLSLAFNMDRRSIFLPGQTSDGHHTIEQACNSCHEPFSAVANKNCTRCHESEIREDTHPVRLFDDPRWAEMLRKVNALECINCHREHRVVMRGVTVEKEFCFPCHDDVTVKRKSHRDLAPASCWDGGCHNYHDNTGLNIAFLTKRFGSSAPAPAGAVLRRAVATSAASLPLPDAPVGSAVKASLNLAWQGSMHARRDVNCSDCHGSEKEFDTTSGEGACVRCHGFEIESLKRGKHGARAAVQLAALTPADARRPMKPQAAKKILNCSTCHDPHSVNTRMAAVEACLGCHDDTHSKNFKGSKHALSFAAESGASPSETAVTCATCHMPRTRTGDPKTGRVAVNHNNSWTLLPRDRMVKEVCLSCHSLEFSMNSMFDDDLVRSNFTGAPQKEHQTLKMVDGEIRERSN